MGKLFNKYINDADYVLSIKIDLPKVNGKRVRKLVWSCKIFTAWKSMVNRCTLTDKYPTYINVSICEEWHLFSNFKAWTELQDWKGKQLDKDLLVQGNKVYGPDTCVFVTSKLNSLLSDSRSIRGDYPIGVHLETNGRHFKAAIGGRDSKINLGYFLTPQEAHKAWQVAKKGIILKVAQEQTDERLKTALLLRCTQLQYDIDNEIETIKL